MGCRQQKQQPGVALGLPQNLPVCAESADFIYDPDPQILFMVRSDFFVCVGPEITNYFGCDANQTCAIARRWPIYMHTAIYA